MRVFTPIGLGAFLVAIICLLGARPARAWDEWANSVIDYSTQYGTSNWSAAQVLDLPDTTAYGDIGTAWTASTINGTTEHVTVGFPEPLYASGATVRETYGNGFVTKIETLDKAGTYRTVWSGTDTSQPGSPVNFLATWPQTSYLVTGIRVTVNTSHSTVWEEIDAIQLHGAPADDLTWASDVVAVSSELRLSPGDNSAFQATGLPDVLHYGNNPHAWASATMNGGAQTITLGFGRNILSTGVTIRETCGNGFVTRVDAIDAGGTAHTVWTGTDTSPSNMPGWLTVAWPQAAYQTAALRIFIDTAHTTDWEEIDAVYIHGQALPVPAPVLASLSASEVMKNGWPFPLVVRGGNFLLTTVVRWNDSDRPTTYVSPGEIHAAIPASDLATLGPASITVFTPAPGGGLSNALSLSVTPDVGQWASSVLAFSSQYSTGNWSAAQALGPPDTVGYGDIGTSWTSDHADVGLQSLTLGYAQPVNSIGAMIRETYNNGFVTKIEALDTTGVYHSVWTGKDLSPPGASVNGQFSWNRTGYLTRGLRITVNTDFTPSWEEIDAVQLQGSTATGVLLAAASPNPLLAGGPAMTLVISGSGFANGATVKWKGVSRAATFVSSNVLTLPLTAADIATPGTVSLTVTVPGTGTSNSVDLAIGPAKYGDADGSGTVNMLDAAVALRAAAGLRNMTALAGGDVAPAYPNTADTGYGDGQITVLDAIRIARLVRGL